MKMNKACAITSNNELFLWEKEKDNNQDENNLKIKIQSKINFYLNLTNVSEFHKRERRRARP